MALINILNDISSILGLSITDDNEKNFLTDNINIAAREIYNSGDLPGSIREQIFQFNDTDNYQISFPYYIEKLRAIRFYNTYGGKIALEDLRPRYHSQRWGTGGLIRWKVKVSDNCLAADITNAAPLTFSLPTGKLETTDIVITIIGKTASSSRVTETITILAGQSSAVSLNGYDEVESIFKTAYNTYNITITDVDDNELGVIPNSELRPLYTIVQVRQDDFQSSFLNNYPQNTIEVLYKHRFSPFRNMYDEFPCPNCDKIIFWKFVEHYCAYKPGFESRSLAAYSKVKQLIDELSLDDQGGKQLTLEYSPNPMYDAQKCALGSDQSLLPYAPTPIITSY
jgi:hypothetical protein